MAPILLWIAFRWVQPAHDPVYQGKRPLPTAQPSATLQAMSETSFDIHYVARLARLELSAAEEQKLGGQLRQVLDYVEQLKRVDISNVEPTAHAIPLANVTRADEIRPSLAHEDALRNAPASANGLFIVPKIVE